MSGNQPGPYAQQDPRRSAPGGVRQGPYAQQTPYGQQPQGTQGAYGGSGGGSGESAGGRAGRGRLIGIVVGALAVVAAGAGGYFAFGPGGQTAYRLTTPGTVAGDYQRDGKGIRGDGSAFGGKKVPGMKSNANVSAKYKSGMLKQLQLGGAYGTVADPGKAVDWVLAKTRAGQRDSTGATAKGGAESFHPKGFDGDVLKCQEFKVSTMGMAVCVWGDSSTVGTVTSFELAGGQTTRPVNLAHTAELTAKVRKDALVPRS